MPSVATNLGESDLVMTYRLVVPTAIQAAAVNNAISWLARLVPTLSQTIERLTIIYAEAEPIVFVDEDVIVVNPGPFGRIPPEEQVVLLGRELMRGDVRIG
jgi:hypothetical protein